MKKYVVVFFILVFLTGCKSSDIEVKTKDTNNKNISKSDIDSISNNLKIFFEEHGYAFSFENANKNILEGERINISLNSEENLQVFIYETENDAYEDAKRIGTDGYTYEKDNMFTIIDWVESPHFYKYNNIIILYLGEDESLLKLISSNFGDEFAGQ